MYEEEKNIILKFYKTSKFYSDISFIQTPLPLLTVFLLLSGLIFILLGLIAEIQIRVYFESQLKNTYKVASKKNIS